MNKRSLLISVFAFAMLLTGCSGESQSNNSRSEGSSAITENSGNSSESSDNTSGDTSTTSSESSTNSGSESSTNSGSESSTNSGSQSSTNSGSESSTNSDSGSSTNSGSESSTNSGSESSTSSNSEASSSDKNNSPAVSGTDLSVCFGDEGSPFALHLYDNDTAKAIARHVGTADWRLPIYHYDDYENWEVMQYYDIPSRYEIPSNAEKVTSEKAGEVYYSEPNRIILFYGDAKVSGEYTRVGYFDFNEEFKQAVENNPVLEGWGNKIVLISSKN